VIKNLRRIYIDFLMVANNGNVIIFRDVKIMLSSFWSFNMIIGH